MTIQRKIGKAIAAILFFMVLPLTTTGCWDRLEINDVALVVAMGVDLDDDGNYRFSAQFPLPGQMGGPKGGGGGTGGSKSSYVDSETGTTMREAAIKMQRRMSRRMIYGHYRVLIIGEELARKGLGESLDIFTRWPENRMTSYVIVAKGRAVDLLGIQPKLERFSAEAMRELIKVGGYMPFTIKNFAQSADHVGSDAIIPYLGKTHIQDKKNAEEIEIIGYAQFRGDRMVDIMKEETGRGISWLRRESRSRFASVLSSEPAKMVFHINRSQTNITPKIDDKGNLTFYVNVTASLVLVENMSNANITNDRTFNEVRANVAGSIKQEIEKTAALMQKNGADSADLGLAVYRKYPRRWLQTYTKNWPERLRQASFQVTVDADIVRDGMTFEQIVREAGK